VNESEPGEIAEKVRILEEQVSTSRNQRNELNKEAKKLAETRDELNEKFKRLKEEIQTVKNKRNELNAQVQSLKAKRDEARAVVSRNRAEVKALTEKLRALDTQAPGTYQSTKKDLEKLEWQIQTTPLSQREEYKLISRVKELEGQLAILKKKKEIEKKIAKLHNESKSIELQANIIHKRLTELAEESEVYHKRMMEIVSSATELKKKADEAHHAYMNTRTQGDNAHLEYVAKLGMIKELEDQIRSYYEAEEALKEEEIRKKIEDLATNKLKKGKKLTFEEFKLLVDRGAV